MTLSAWSCLSRIPESFETVDYEDSLGSQYGYDSNVVNCRQVAVGDVLIIRDHELIYGFGLVADIIVRRDAKIMRRCPKCRSASTVKRKVKIPENRCNDCGNEFEAPLLESKDVDVYVASYDGQWFPLPSPIPARALLPVYSGRDRQNAIRRLDVSLAFAVLRAAGSVESYLQLELVARSNHIGGGRIEALVQRRMGQHRFRAGLLERFGATCAVTGVQPEVVLDAAHLYNFAERPVHELDEGLLLRADLHRMFDRLLLTFDPESWTSHVAPGLLARNTSLRALDGRPIMVPADLLPNRALIADHHKTARKRWSVGA